MRLRLREYLYMYEMKLIISEFGNNHLPVINIDSNEYEEYLLRVKNNITNIGDYNSKHVVPIEKINGNNVSMLLYELLKDKLMYCTDNNRLYIKDEYTILKDVTSIESYIMNKISKDYKYWFEGIHINLKKHSVYAGSYFNILKFNTIWKLMKSNVNNSTLVDYNIYKNKIKIIDLNDAIIYKDNNKMIIEYEPNKFKNQFSLDIYLCILKKLEKMRIFIKLRMNLYNEMHENIRIYLSKYNNDILNPNVIYSIISNYNGIHKYVAFFIYLWDFILSKYEM
jgi:hypothetical protein